MDAVFYCAAKCLMCRNEYHTEFDGYCTKIKQA